MYAFVYIVVTVILLIMLVLVCTDIVLRVHQKAPYKSNLESIHKKEVYLDSKFKGE